MTNQFQTNQQNQIKPQQTNQLYQLTEEDQLFHELVKATLSPNQVIKNNNEAVKAYTYTC